MNFKQLTIAAISTLVLASGCAGPLQPGSTGEERKAKLLAVEPRYSEDGDLISYYMYLDDNEWYWLGRTKRQSTILAHKLKEGETYMWTIDRGTIYDYAVPNSEALTPSPSPTPEFNN